MMDSVLHLISIFSSKGIHWYNNELKWELGLLSRCAGFLSLPYVYQMRYSALTNMNMIGISILYLDHISFTSSGNRTLHCRWYVCISQMVMYCCTTGSIVTYRRTFKKPIVIAHLGMEYPLRVLVRIFVGDWVQVWLYQYRKHNHWDKTDVRHTHLHNWIPYTFKTAYLCWISTLVTMTQVMACRLCGTNHFIHYYWCMVNVNLLRL